MEPEARGIILLVPPNEDGVWDRQESDQRRTGQVFQDLRLILGAAQS